MYYRNNGCNSVISGIVALLKELTADSVMIKTGLRFFNWRCAMASVAVSDYIVVRERCHLVVPNHSAEFWRLVERLLPDYEVRQDWLRTYGVRMSF